MAERIPTRLTAAEGRKFGFTVGLAFLALGGVLLWRGRQLPAMLLLGAGGLLALGGLLVPTRLGTVERGWMALAHALSRVTTPIFMGVVYFGIMTPIGLIRRRTSGAMLANRTGTGSRWRAHDVPADQRAALEHQF